MKKNASQDELESIRSWRHDLMRALDKIRKKEEFEDLKPRLIEYSETAIRSYEKEMT